MTKSKIIRLPSLLVLSLILTLVSFTPIAAQSSTATLSGTVRDENGAVIAGATVSVADLAKGLKREGATNENGSFTFPLLPPSTYTVTVERQGFTPVEVREVILNVGDQKALSFEMKVGSVDAAVEVTSDPPLTNESAAVGTIVNQQFIKDMPLNGRSFQSLLLLTPGMVFTSSEQGQLSVNGGRTDSNYFTVDGASANIGVGVQSLYDQSASGAIPGFNSFGGTQNLLQLDAMSEVRIQTSNYSAAYGRQPGAQVSLISKSGTNKYHGSVFEYLRNSAFDANDWFSNNLGVAKVPNRQNDFGGTFGGPVQIPRIYNGKNKTFFFFSYEGLRLALPQPTRIFNVPAACLHDNPALNPFLQALVDAFPVPNTNLGSCDAGANGRGTFKASWSNYTNMDSYALRVDQNFGQKWNVFFRADHSRSQGETYNLGQLSHWPVATDTETAGVTTQITKTVYSSFRFNFSRNIAQDNIEWTNKFGGKPIDNISDFLPSGAPDYSIPYFLIGGQAYEVGPYTDHRSKDWNAVENITWMSGNHSFTFGTDLRWRNPLYLDNGYVFQISFSTLPNILANKGSGALITALPIEAHVKNYSFYGNDTWRVNQRLTLDLGLRWDINPAPTLGNYNMPAFTGFPDVAKLALAPAGTPYYPTFKREFAPRLGVAYKLWDKANMTTVLRGGWGIFYDLGTGTALATSHSYPFSVTQSIPLLPFPFAPGTVADITLPAPMTTPIGNSLTGASGRFGLQYLDGLPRTQQYSFGVEQQLGKNQVISVSYVGNHGEKLLNRYQYAFLDATTNPNVIKGTTLFITRNDGKAGGYSWYNSLQVTYMRRMSSGLQVLANYTRSRATDAFSNDSTINSSRVPNSVLDQDASIFYGLSDYDRPNIFNLALVYELPRLRSDNTSVRWLERIFTNGWEASSNFKYQSGTPFSMNFTYYDVTNGTGTVNLRLNRVDGQPLYISDPINPGGQAINPAAFAIPAADLQPNQALVVNGDTGRNNFRGPGLSQLDLAIRRDFSITERVKLQFSVELFNALNHPNFLNPDGSYGYVFNSPSYGPSPCPGNPSGMSCDFNFPNPRNGPHTAFFTSGTFGELNYLANGVSAGSGPGSRFDISLNPRYSLGGPRSAQFSLRLSF
jgi:hypothetical protein